jgi:hypothetical protein
MPVYYARGVAAHLGTMPFDTIAPNIVFGKGEKAKRQYQIVEKRLLSSKALPEKSIRFPGEEASFGLHWLENAPFMQVQVDSMY